MYTHALVLKKVAQAFPDPTHAASALLLLDDYSGPAIERVQLAAIMSCDGSLERLKGLLECANRDFRDVLVAEFQEEFCAPLSTPEAELIEIRKRDRARYEAWLASGDTPTEKT